MSSPVLLQDRSVRTLTRFVSVWSPLSSPLGALLFQVSGHRKQFLFTTTPPELTDGFRGVH